jgi:hypothetical protein
MSIPPLRSKKQVAANKAAAKKRAAASKARQKVAADKRALAKKRQPYKNFGLTKKTLEERYTPAEIKKLKAAKKKPAKKVK